MKRSCLPLALVALLLALPSAAHADWRVDRAAQIARIVWHHPCVDRMRITWAPFDDRAGEAVQTGSLTADGDCELADPVVTLNSLDPSLRDWEPFCDTVLHEAGHLAGRGHSDNPDSIMFPVRVAVHMQGNGRDRWEGVDRRCLHGGRPFLRAHGLGTVK